MKPIPVIAVFDVGKTNKKVFLFDESYRPVYQRSVTLPETQDEDGDACEDLDALRRWVLDKFNEISGLKAFKVKAVNFSAYGASLVHIDEDGHPVCPLYNYLKPYPEKISKAFYLQYGGEDKFSLETASPVLGSLNSGLQIYRLKKEQPAIFKKISYALHLPQYLSFLLSGKACSDITSIGCHTGLWDFEKKRYHEWVKREGLDGKLAPIAAAHKTSPAILSGANYQVGTGLHDSSAALIPYLLNFTEPFVLISTGTWCISLNPFNQKPLTAEQLKMDGLCYLQYQGEPVKASRIFSGHEHGQQVKRIAKYFHTAETKYQDMPLDPGLINKLKKASVFSSRDLAVFRDDAAAYHQLVADLVALQVKSTGLVLKGTNARRIFVEGGFARNRLYMHLLAAAFPGMEVSAAVLPQASALGAALVLHDDWNSGPRPSGLITLKHYP